MSLETQETLRPSRTTRYRTDDPLQNLRIKVVIQSEESENQDDWMKKETVFGWQEKVFGPAEYQKYKALAEEGLDKLQQEQSLMKKSLFGADKDALTPLDEKYIQSIEQVAQEETVYSYVDADTFEDKEEYLERMTDAPSERATGLALQLNEIEKRRGRHSEKSKAFRMMYIAADLKGKRDQTKPAEENVHLHEEHVLLRIKAYADGTVDMTPGFSPKAPIKVDIMNRNEYKIGGTVPPYRITTAGGYTYHYWILNESEPADQATISKIHAKHLRFQQELFDKTQELRRNFVGEDFEAFTENPEEDELKAVLNLEIMSCEGFDLDCLYIQYYLEIPKGWTCPEDAPLYGNTQLSYTKAKKEDGRKTLISIAHFAHPIEVTCWRSTGMGETCSWPRLLVQVNSYDQWDRQRTVGYGYLPVAPITQYKEEEVSTWAPTPTQVGRMRSFFIGGSPELKDLTFAGIPENQVQNHSFPRGCVAKLFQQSIVGEQAEGMLSRFGFATTSAGTVRIRINAVVQGSKPPQPKTSALHKAVADKLRKGGHAVADAVSGDRDAASVLGHAAVKYSKEKREDDLRSRISGRS